MSWRLVDGWILYLRCWFSVTQTLTWMYVYMSVTYISWSSDFALYLEDCLLDNAIIGILVPYGAKIYLIKCMWVSDLHFMVQCFCLISWRLFDGLMLYWDIDSVWHKHWTETIYVGQWPVFYGPVILPYILKTFWWTNVIIGLLDPCDATIYHIKCMRVSDLHFMVQWFCLISWRLLNGFMLYWRYWFSVTQTLTWNYICKSVTCSSWSSDFALYLEDYLMDKCHNWNTGSMWSKDFRDKMYMSQWPTFHGPVILSYLEDYLMN